MKRIVREENVERYKGLGYKVVKKVESGTLMEKKTPTTKKPAKKPAKNPAK